MSLTLKGNITLIKNIERTLMLFCVSFSAVPKSDIKLSLPKEAVVQNAYQNALLAG